MNSAEILERHRNFLRIRHLLAFCGTIVVIFFLVFYYQSARSYRAAVREGQDDTRRLTHILADHVELSLLGVDLTLRRAVERQYLNSMFGNNLPQYMEQNFRAWLSDTPQIAALALINNKGQVEVAAHKKNYAYWMDYSRGILGETLFEHLRDADDRAVFIGKHYTKENAPLIVVSRRFHTVNGEFGGILLAAVDPAWFVSFYQAVASGEHRYMAITLPDGSLLASGPTASIANETVIMDLIRQQQGTGAFSGKEPLLSTVSAFDRFHLIGQQRLPSLPVLVNVLLDEDDVLVAWRQNRAKDVGFVALFTIFGSVLAFFAIAMARQITRAEESEETAILASQAKSEFLANMSHELRTPLNAIIGFSEMINSGYFGPLNPKQKERVHDINLCGTHLLQLINDILEFSKGDAGKLELVEERVDLRDIVGECLRMMQGKLATRRIELISSIEPGLPPLWGDKRKIRQILLNLLTNSVKFTAEGGSIRIVCMQDAQRAVSLIVSDTGIGIPEADIPQPRRHRPGSAFMQDVRGTARRQADPLQQGRRGHHRAHHLPAPAHAGGKEGSLINSCLPPTPR